MALRFAHVVERLHLVRHALLAASVRRAEGRDASAGDDVIARLSLLTSCTDAIVERWVKGVIDEASAARELSALIALVAARRSRPVRRARSVRVAHRPRARAGYDAAEGGGVAARRSVRTAPSS
jgi:hypothetical protein